MSLSSLKKKSSAQVDAALACIPPAITNGTCLLGLVPDLSEADLATYQNTLDAMIGHHSPSSPIDYLYCQKAAMAAVRQHQLWSAEQAYIANNVATERALAQAKQQEHPLAEIRERERAHHVLTAADIEKTLQIIRFVPDLSTPAPESAISQSGLDAEFLQQENWEPGDSYFYLIEILAFRHIWHDDEGLDIGYEGVELNWYELCTIMAPWTAPREHLDEDRLNVPATADVVAMLESLLQAAQLRCVAISAEAEQSQREQAALVDVAAAKGFVLPGHIADKIIDVQHSIDQELAMCSRHFSNRPHPLRNA